MSFPRVQSGLQEVSSILRWVVVEHFLITNLRGVSDYCPMTDRMQAQKAELSTVYSLHWQSAVQRQKI